VLNIVYPPNSTDGPPHLGLRPTCFTHHIFPNLSGRSPSRRYIAMTTFMTLPNEILLIIASYLDTIEIYGLILSNRRLNALLEHRLYRNLTPRDVAWMVHFNKLVAFRQAITAGLDLNMEIAIIENYNFLVRQPLLAYVACE
jgi:hypothetical protein